MAKVLWGSKTPGQANDQRDEVILANKKKVLLMYYTYFRNSNPKSNIGFKTSVLNLSCRNIY